MPRGVYDRTKAKPRGRPRKEMREIVEEKIAPLVRRALRPKVSTASSTVGTVTIEIAGKRVSFGSDGGAIIVRIEP